MILRFPSLTGFDWDEGNQSKNEIKHGVTAAESEQAFFNEPLVLLDQAAHGSAEARYAILGSTDHDRLLTIIYTVRGSRIRVISARPMSRKERIYYHEHAQDHPEV